MKIAWATPFNRNSTIGCEFSNDVARELMLRGHEIEIIRTELQKAAKLPAADFAGRIHPPGTFNRRSLLSGFDVVIVNWGAGFYDHGGALALAGGAPSVAIFHDNNMGSFVADARKYYGLPADSFTFPARPGTHAEVEGPSVLAWFAALSASAIVHDQQCLPLVQKACPGPVCCLPKPVADQSPPFAKGYVDAILSLIDSAIWNRPILDAGLQIGAIFEACGAPLDEPAIGRLGGVIDGLFGPRHTGARPPAKASGK